MATAAIFMREDSFRLHLPPARMARLRRLCTVVEPAPWSGPPGAALLSRVEILLTGWGTPRLGARDLEAMPLLRLVAHTAGTVKSIVPRTWLDAGIRVAQAGAANAWPVAEYTLAVILLANKGFWHWSKLYLRKREDFSRWDHPETAGVGNRGRVIGVVGGSRVGRMLIGLLRRHDFEILLADPFVTEAEAAAMGATLVELPTLLATSDVVTLHPPLLERTRGMLGAAELAAMRDGAILVNTARGGIVDQSALIAELATGRLNAILDVTDPEPLSTDSPLWGMENVILTPHIAGSMGNEIVRMTDLALDEVERHLAGAALEHEVTLANWERMA